MAVWPPSAEDLIATNKKLQEENKRLRTKLRDLFAMSALNTFTSDEYGPEEMAGISYDIADAMLKAREE